MDDKEKPNFNPVLYIADGPVDKNPAHDTWLHNIDGVPKLSPERPKSGSNVARPTHQLTELGTRYVANVIKTKVDKFHNTINELSFTDDTGTLVDQLVYAPLVANSEILAFFGGKLISPGECFNLNFSTIEIHTYTYGIWAMFQSPYLPASRNRDLLPHNWVDFEHHAFPHVFCSQAKQHLVISLARYQPATKEIRLADVWVPPKHMLYLPETIESKEPNSQIFTLHGNRNSALACRDVDAVNSIKTQTILAKLDSCGKQISSSFYHSQTPTVHRSPLN
ncbi:hypothetical protein GCM10008090_05880 [Arenicella chitinivorans]|uniref:Uncharacterized protein n=1 Tax=Arenicella chitinivorans TaxID=1329800 RepID=A0A918RKH6_9GAMM|nr:hypothetical protein [Arenicella chitinivorans]GHA00042.1 hypothetical protein GCM10008090_05880 [Arenicella chitinivorans]